MSEHDLEDEYEVIVMTGENGDNKEFFVLDAANVDGSNYILVVDAEADEEEDEIDAIIFKEIREEDDNLVYELVEDDEEFEKVVEIFSENEDFDIEA